jgi:hypothetical protein
MKSDSAKTGEEMPAARASAGKAALAAGLCGSMLGWFFPFEAQYQYFTFVEEGLVLLNDPGAWALSGCCFMALALPAVAAALLLKARPHWLGLALIALALGSQAAVFSAAGWALTPWAWINLSASVISLCLSIGFLVNKGRKS